ncbi:class I SAM-dependent methyltransferase [Microlunatus speluncae]|uniref:class I SAM-dependent methyltransferase n=1 Tax=Microlunatus speluncae TaxID=2594267 RepID=UPI0012663EF3|nr:class I SAM-dependent methyltransferase [Microlunatus speluncae]
MPNYDTRIVELYDVDNGDGPDHDFYRQLADTLNARTVIDLGCGTGQLTVTLATPGREVVGVDPSSNMINYARARPGAERVQWITGDSRDLPPGRHDLALMTGNVAQHILDPDWPRTLSDLHRTLRPGGTVAFETRNPAGRAWQRWVTPEAEATTRSTPFGLLREWLELEIGDAGVITMIAHNVFEETGEHVVERESLVFRDRATVERQLAAAGFAVEATWAGWDRSPLRSDSPLMIFQATSRG